ncbi:hypothetical protein [Pelagibius sp. Alg239-R121]|uniref:hypothetical protein n=1 Tax=Pelagibius sp. Alg239-R121 TaxID=2993448 RepID=UPI0024A6B9B8|nr:hypothetical protein [Pelagibius sp. Alg239-R121]
MSDLTSNLNRLSVPETPRPNALRRLFAHPHLSQYRRLATLVIVANLLYLAMGLHDGIFWTHKGPALAQLSNLAVANLTFAILIRQQYVINFLFWAATRVPTSWPLSIRWTLGKVFHFGGLHSGGATMGSLWVAFFCGAALWELSNDSPRVSIELGAVSAALVALLIVMLVTALSPLRAKFHNMFERVHRFGGWAALALFWAQSLLFIRGQGVSTFETPAFWALCMITFSIALPWLRLKKVPVEIVKPSDHAVAVRFNYGDDAFPGSSNAISRNPLLEWHSFASIPAPGERGYRLIISRAGDWTGKFIDDCPSHVWVKGITTSGVARIEVLFKRVVYVATGSGIGPVLPHLLAQQLPIHLIWATRSPRKTYGDAIVDEILRACPDAHIWDTDSHGKPDLAALSLQACRSFDAEAVICISNQKLTRHVVAEMERRGIPAFGAIWDS